ncbi:EAL domain-containing protein [Orrella sp. JC864]|uniref:EAL domain-containing protein n=1 Tax=Orrella sp. JC864 TaxID=3120298 RepID=UPI003008F30F
MANPSPSKMRTRWAVLLAAALPLLLGLASTFYAADRAVRRQAEETAQIVLRHAEAVADHAWRTVGTLRRYANQECEHAEAQLQRQASLSGYFRSIGLTRGAQAYCSSTFGMQTASLAEVLEISSPQAPQGRWSLSVAGTPGVRDRPAVIFADIQPDGPGAYAIVDAQYLGDFMRAIGESRAYRIALRVGQGVMIEAGSPIPPGHFLFSPSRVDLASARYPVTVSVISPVAAATAQWWQAFSALLPMSVILSLCLSVAAYRWQQRKLSFRDEIRRGIANGEFTVHYQPIYDSRRRRCNGVEALLRWQRQDGSWMRPDVFIAAAESEGVIVELTRHLFDRVAQDVCGWRIAPGFHLNLNVAAEHLQAPDFVADVQALCARLQAHSPCITLELTERGLISNGPDVLEGLHKLRTRGVRLAIDDFGTGHCGMSYLQTFPLDYLKIDRGFVQAIESLDGETPVLDTIISLAHKLALGTVAEGVETRLQLDYLLARGVVYIQGYLYAQPMPADRLEHWLRTAGEQPL